MNSDNKNNRELMSGIEESQAQALSQGRIRAIVAEHIEPVTRFDNADLSETTPEEELQVRINLTLEQKLHFDISIHNGKGRLGCKKLKGSTDFESALDEELGTAIQNAPVAIKNWILADTAAYRRMMPAQSGFLVPSESVGYEYTCNGCNGACEVMCSSCTGVGRLSCLHCNTSGKIKCYQCRGAKRLSCNYCSGRGGKTETITTQVWNSSAGRYDSQQSSQYKSCGYCSASGFNTCYACDWGGEVQCSNCIGTGKVSCTPCGATGRVNCTTCNATGILNQSGSIIANVTRTETLDIHTDDSKLESLVRAKILVADLPQYGSFLNVKYHMDGLSTQATHDLRLDVLRAEIYASEKNFEIYGFGSKPTVLDFENIAGHMLEDDLVALERRIDSTAAWCLRSENDLLKITASFLQSELNMLIAEKITDTGLTSKDAAKEVEKHFFALVDIRYVERASLALKTALSRLYSAELFEHAVYLCCLIALTAGVLHVLGENVLQMFELRKYNTSFILLSVGLVAWIVLEILARRRIARGLDSAFLAQVDSGLSNRVIKQLSVSDIVRNWRIGIGIGVILAIFITPTLIDKLPFVQNLNPENRASFEASKMLDAWFDSTSTDFKQRNYPSRAWLELHANNGEANAQTVLGLQLLLGAGGIKKDIETAKHWIDIAKSKDGNSDYVRIANLILVLHKSASSEQLIDASAQLKALADSSFDFVEARYWEARTKLDDRSPVYDLAKGIAVLTKAADAKHAHAALMLGERFATGNGIQYNSSLARKYLEIAAAGGLSEANEVMKTLK